jgi:hypothetical protein
MTTIFTLSNAQPLKKLLLKQNPDCKDVQIISCKSDPNLFIAILQEDPDWWETLNVVNYKDGKIRWKAQFDSLPGEQSIRSARQITLKGITNPLIEVYGQTHNGNGFFYLYELNGKTAKLLLMTRAVDESSDGAVEINHQYYDRIFKNGHLKPTYKDFNQDGISDVKLTGTILICLDKEHIYKQYPAQKVFIYNKTKKKYVQDIKLRQWFEHDDD